MKRTDLVGMVLALTCVVHCMAMPLVLVYLPVLGMGWLADPKVHYTLLGTNVGWVVVSTRLCCASPHTDSSVGGTGTRHYGVCSRLSGRHVLSPSACQSKRRSNVGQADAP
jgi:MerC mercury resistance protein